MVGERLEYGENELEKTLNEAATKGRRACHGGQWLCNGVALGCLHHQTRKSLTSAVFKDRFVFTISLQNANHFIRYPALNVDGAPPGVRTSIGSDSDPSLKLKCDKKNPCSSCGALPTGAASQFLTCIAVRRGCDSICPTGTLANGMGKKYAFSWRLSIQ